MLPECNQFMLRWYQKVRLIIMTKEQYHNLHILLAALWIDGEISELAYQQLVDELQDMMKGDK